MERTVKAAWQLLFKKKGKTNKGKIRNNKNNKNIYTQTNNFNRNSQQVSITGINLDKKDMEEFGDKIGKKDECELRIITQNANRLSANKDTTKSRKLFSSIDELEADVWISTETGLYWPKVSEYDQWHERLQEDPKKFRYQLSYNKNEKEYTEANQQGGTAITVTETIAHRVIKRGQDESGLGRWSWVLIQGKHKTLVRIVSAYRPYNSDEVNSVMMQHYRHFKKEDRRDEHRKIINPRTAFYKDIKAVIKTWKEEGNHIIIGIDANEDIRNGETEETFRELEMVECILNRHSKESPPATNNRNTKRQPIDGIFTTPGINPTRAGYLPFGEGGISDHRVLWVDFNYIDILGYNGEVFATSEPRRLNCKIPKIKNKYKKLTRQLILNTGMSEEIQNIQQEARREGMTEELLNRYNKVHKESTKKRKIIEKQIRKLKMGKVPWTPKLQRYRDEITAWENIKKQFSGIKVSKRFLQRLQDKVNLPHHTHYDSAHINEKLDKAYKEYKLARKNAELWRDDWEITLAKDRAINNNTSYEVELKKIKNIKHQKKIAAAVKRARGKFKNPTAKVFINVDNARIECNTKEEVEHACIQEYISRCSQAEDTPPMNPPILPELGYLCEGPAIENILQGTYSPDPETDLYACQLLKHLEMPAIIKGSPSLTNIVTIEDHIESWRKQKEGIASDPSGLSFSHFKAGIEDNIIAQYDATIRSLPYQYGFVPDMWKTMTDVAILKKAGVYDIGKMRTIVLMNSEYNMNNKKLGKEVMSNAEKNKTVAPEQYGSRKNKKSIEALLNKRLTCDILRQTRTAAALCSNDAKSCYDRIVHNIGMLSLLRQGAPMTAVKVMCQTLQEARHYVSTAFGRSEDSYTSDSIPFQGLGQGNGCAPTTWAMISTPIIEVMRTAGWGFQITTAITKAFIKFVCYSFVDDTDLIHSAKTVNTPGFIIIEEMQKALDMWEGGLRATGGALVPSKSYWYMIDFKWINNQWTYVTKEDSPEILTLRTSKENRTVLRRLNPNESKETLGVYLAVDGNNNQTIKELKNKVIRFGDQIRTGNLNPNEAWYALNSTIMKTIEYQLPAITLSEKEWQDIMSPLWCRLLPKANINRNFPRDLIYAAKDHYGLGVYNPYINQYLTQIETLLTHLKADTMTGDLIRTSAEQLRLELGTNKPLTKCQWEQRQESITDCWLKNLFAFMEKNNIQMEDSIEHLSAQREQDQCIMDIAVEAGYKGEDLKLINEARMFMKICFVSEMCTGNGKSIIPQVYEGTFKNTETKYRWPRLQHSLSPRHWNMWKRFISKAIIDNNKRVKIHLGKSLQKQDTWKWWWTPAEERIYYKDQEWNVYAKTNRRTHRISSQRYKKLDGINEEKPPNSVPVYIQHQGNFIKIAGQVEFAEVEEEETLFTYEQLLTSNSAWAFQKVSTKDEGKDVAEAIRLRKARAVSDGSYKDNKGTSATILEGLDEGKSIISVNTVPGPPQAQSAYQSELAGILATLLHTQSLCTKYNITEGEIVIACDGQSALYESKYEGPVKVTTSSSDILTAIRSIVKNIPIDIKWHWVKGHQDNNSNATSALDFWAKRNILCDGLAKIHWNTSNENVEKVLINNSFPTIYINDEIITQFDKNALYAKLTRNSTIKYWSKRTRVEERVLREIDWNVCHRAYKSLNFSKQRRVVKMLSNHAPTGKTLQKRREWDHARCPRCGENGEDVEHVLICTNIEAQTKWRTSVEKLEKWMKQTKTAPHLKNAFIQHLNYWHKGKEIHFTTSNRKMRSAIDHQNKIGWNNVPLGLISPKWNEVQEQYHTKMKNKYTLGKRWIAELIKKCWMVSWDMWEHRNGILHGQMTTAEKKKEEKILNIQIEAELKKGVSQLDQFAENLFNMTHTSILNKPVSLKRNWIHTITVAREQEKYKRQKVNHMRSGLHRYFTNRVTEDRTGLEDNLTSYCVLVQYNLLVILVTGAFQPFGIVVAA